MKFNRLKKTGAVAASLLVATTLAAQGAFAQNIENNIVKSLSLGHFTAVQYDDSKNAGDTAIAKTSNDDDNTVTTSIKKGEEVKVDMLNVTDSSKLRGYTCFNIKLPAYLPEGYSFEKASFYKDESGNVKDSKYADLYFINNATGKEIYMQERFACDETKAELGTDDTIESIKINGVDAILEGKNNIDWEADNTIYYLNAKDMTKDEAIKIAESVK